MKTISTVRLDGFLSFAPGSEAFDLMPLNVLIGPNGAGKTNLVEAFDLLAATPTDLAAPVRQGGGIGEWLWKGEGTANAATVEVVMDAETPTGRPLRYRLEFGEVPRFERLSTRIAGGTVQFYLHENGFSSPVSAARISDGTLRFIAFLATLLAPDPPPLVCIEEPEIGLHPDAVSLVADLLVEASSRMQIVATTHSDALVSALSNHVESVVVCERPGTGTVMQRLEAARLKDWLDSYLLGDLWRMGELGANP